MRAHNGGYTAPAAITFDGDDATTVADMSKVWRLKSDKVKFDGGKNLGVGWTIYILRRSF